jgi:hypothetical protein
VEKTNEKELFLLVCIMCGGKRTSQIVCFAVKVKAFNGKLQQIINRFRVAFGNVGSERVAEGNPYPQFFFNGENFVNPQQVNVQSHLHSKKRRRIKKKREMKAVVVSNKEMKEREVTTEGATNKYPV